ncbi:hypothetical protein [Actinomadura miaoliensis]|uniref:hypothetical protein n=1 Tax=Actinomadura miaoliensis TaxID=430685 RepID=UPI0031EC97E1
MQQLMDVTVESATQSRATRGSPSRRIDVGHTLDAGAGDGHPDYDLRQIVMMIIGLAERPKPRRWWSSVACSAGTTWLNSS